eukprot:TRINITY_DN63423_c0_g1_i1.p1 TRINITY_DN63423_c0_g1~~TRINITY_DN63423_c0_g1_i1.p1  ORF type:complete len:433 (-),score=71.17 TRINITY_DN63423_c0_g1_i1:93-1352(-)
MANVAEVEAILKNTFGDSLASWAPVGEPRRMGFSGSTLWTLRCVYNDANAAAASAPEVPTLLTLKHTLKQEPTLPGTADEGRRARAIRTDFSYGNEVTFLRTHAEQLRVARSCRVPRTLSATGNEDSYTILMESLDGSLGWEQHVDIPTGAHTRAALRWLARFHASFLPTERGGGGLPLITSGMWELGSHMAVENRPVAELERIATILASFLDKFADVDPLFRSAGAQSIGPRLQAVAKDIAWQLRPEINGTQGGARVATMVHADFKQANLFFRGAAGEDGEPEVGAIDWQWSGPGVGATDLYCLCAMGLEDETVEDYTANVLRPYHEALIQALGGRDELYPFEELVREFKIAGLDFMRWLTVARLSDVTPQKMAAAAETIDINRGTWSRSRTRMVWIWKRTEEFLSCLDELNLNGRPA